MTVGRKLKRNVFIDTDIDCQNCGCWQRVCTWNGECDNLEPMTNEEYLRSCTTEELAEWIHTAIFDDNFANKMADEAYMNMQTRSDYIEMWLKQPHTTIKE